METLFTCHRRQINTKIFPCTVVPQLSVYLRSHRLSSVQIMLTINSGFLSVEQLSYRFFRTRNFLPSNFYYVQHHHNLRKLKVKGEFFYPCNVILMVYLCKQSTDSNFILIRSLFYVYVCSHGEISLCDFFSPFSLNRLRQFQHRKAPSSRPLRVFCTSPLQMLSPVCNLICINTTTITCCSSSLLI